MDFVICLSVLGILVLLGIAATRWMWHYDDEATSAQRIALHELRGELDRLTYQADGKVQAEQVRRELFRELRGKPRE